MIREKQHMEALKQRATKEKEKLSKLHLITSPDVLRRILSEVDDEDISASKKTRKRLTIIQEQINIRKSCITKKLTFPSLTIGSSGLYMISFKTCAIL